MVCLNAKVKFHPGQSRNVTASPQKRTRSPKHKAPGVNYFCLFLDVVQQTHQEFAGINHSRLNYSYRFAYWKT
jgi:hypothetical protein